MNGPYVRTPANKVALKLATFDWLFASNDTQVQAHEADVALEANLLRLNVIKSDESVASIEGGNGTIYVTLEGGAYLAIDLDGNVSEEQ